MRHEDLSLARVQGDTVRPLRACRGEGEEEEEQLERLKAE